jgi:hypothetical protein
MGRYEIACVILAHDPSQCPYSPDWPNHPAGQPHASTRNRPGKPVAEEGRPYLMGLSSRLAGVVSEFGISYQTIRAMLPRDIDTPTPLSHSYRPDT